MFRFNFDGEADLQSDRQNPSQFTDFSPPESLPLQTSPTADFTSLPFANEWTFKMAKLEQNALVVDFAEILEKSDLVPDLYEGGFRLWECSVDLVDYFIEQRLSFDSLNVLDLGAGHGLPGIFALSHSAASVCFQDLNADVLRYTTAANISLNIASKSARLISGDWRDPRLAEACLAHGDFDRIFSCDTLYNRDVQPALLSILEQCLRINGVAFIAAKSFYFGVGGSTASFLDHAARYGNLQAEIVKTIADGQSNVREIIRLEKTGPR